MKITQEQIDKARAEFKGPTKTLRAGKEFRPVGTHFKQRDPIAMGGMSAKDLGRERKKSLHSAFGARSYQSKGGE